MPPVDPGPRPPLPTYTAMDDIDFRPTRNIFLLTFLFVGYGGGLGTMGVMLAWDTFDTRLHWGDVGGWCLAATVYFGFFWFIVTWLTLARRTRFTDEGIHRWTFSGKTYFVPWGEIRSARASSYKGNIELVLRYGPKKRRLHIMLTDYRHSRRLHDEMARRMAVPFELSPWVLQSLR